MAFSIVGSCAGGMNYGTPVTVQRTTVTAGNLIVALVSATRTGGANTISVSDGTSSFTAGTANTLGNYTLQFFYLLASVASGTVTYTASSTSAAQMWINVWEVTGENAEFDTEDATQHASSAYQGIATPNVTTAGGIAFGGIHLVSANNTAESSYINDTSPDGYFQNTGNKLFLDYLISAGFTGHADFYTPMYSDYMASIIAFKVSGEEPPATGTPSIIARGIGLGTFKGMGIGSGQYP